MTIAKIKRKIHLIIQMTKKLKEVYRVIIMAKKYREVYKVIIIAKINRVINLLMKKPKYFMKLNQE